MAGNEQVLNKVVGKKTIPWSDQEYINFRKRYANLVVDIGTGDGKHVLRWAHEHPMDCIVGIDASISQLAKTSLKTTQETKKGGCPNAVFFQCAAEKLPAVLEDADSIHILMPWGSLLREILPVNGNPSQVLTEIHRISRPGAQLVVTLNLHAWQPRVPEVGDIPMPSKEFILTTVAQEYRKYGITITSAGALDDDIIANYATSWGRRIAASRAEFSVLVYRGIIS